jgi:DNA replication protein DnaC
MTDDELLDPIQGPPISQEWLAEHSKRARAAQEALDAAEITDGKRWLADLQSSVLGELEAWEAMPCKGLLENLQTCTDLIAGTCERRKHIMCPRNVSVRVAEEEAEEHRRRRKQSKTAGIPEHILRVLYDHASQDTQARRLLAEAFSKTPEPSIVVLSGGVGCGKSCAAAEMAILRSGRFVTASELSSGSAYESQARELEQTKFLVIDDLGCEYIDAKGYFLSRLDSLINARYANCLPTVITTNLPATAAADNPTGKSFRQYGERILDRIRECGRFVNVGGQSLRRRK